MEEKIDGRKKGWEIEKMDKKMWKKNWKKWEKIWVESGKNQKNE
jgi:hypothetical protein